MSGLPSYRVETWGCQMNVLDGERMAGQLELRGYRAAGEGQRLRASRKLTPGEHATGAEVAAEGLRRVVEERGWRRLLIAGDPRLRAAVACAAVSFLLFGLVTEAS